MPDGKVNSALEWLRTAKDKFRTLASSEERARAERPRVGLALAGGFARGIAHIGVLRVLLEAGIPIDCVAGTSGGAVSGAAFFAGAPLGGQQATGQGATVAGFGGWSPCLRGRS